MAWETQETKINSSVERLKKQGLVRQYSFLDRVLIEFNAGLETLSHFQKRSPARQNPSNHLPELSTLDADRSLISGLMRVDHTGEICAQALYRGQAFLAREESTREALLQAAQEEEDHLLWCHQRLDELDASVSKLNVFWYTASFAIGLMASVLGDDWSNGFVVETERQVEGHLVDHLERLPPADQKSRAILTQMKQDESDHADAAETRGARPFPPFLKALMRFQSSAMTKTAYWV